ncbi:MAG: hypothetical protein GY757_49305, partial [bacterium]|nr:hypothetical protein [bacterium]
KLRPGEKEEWRITIRGKKGPNDKPGEKVAAEMVATLYDASLDTFRKQNWGFDIYPHHSAKYEWGSNRYFNKSYCNSIGISEKTAPYIRERYDRLNWFGVPPLRGAGLLKSVGSGGGESREEREDRIDYRKEGGERGSGEPDVYTVEARTNFQETAFFYPHLKTGKGGTITLSFTVPEALTKWKMLGFAHTKDLKFGLTTNQLVTQKEMMVVPNTPRFFREGDKLELSAKIVNLSKETRRGTAKLMLFETA